MVASWSLTQEVACSSPFTVMTNIFVAKFSEFSETFRKDLIRSCLCPSHCSQSLDILSEGLILLLVLSVRGEIGHLEAEVFILHPLSTMNTEVFLENLVAKKSNLCKGKNRPVTFLHQ